uniref:Cytochrome P450 n=1 Tax=Ditylenchus dipsaci TaxID=166011 RepID=A0A915DUJ7_9BILA
MHNSSHEFFYNFLNELYEKRKLETAQEREMHNDTFQFLMDTVEVQEQSMKAAGETKTSKKTMSKHRLISQGFLIFVAGYDTTNVVTLLLYTFLGDDEDITYDHTQKLSYLNQIIQETSRMYPILTRARRSSKHCSSQFSVCFPIPGSHTKSRGDGMRRLYTIHQNPEFYANPEIFDPERFSPENKASRDPLTFLAFGYGPRSCIGMRFAEMQMRVVIASIIRNYRLERAENSMDMPLKVQCVDFVKPAETVYINVHKR